MLREKKNYRVVRVLVNDQNKNKKSEKRKEDGKRN